MVHFRGEGKHIVRTFVTFDCPPLSELEPESDCPPILPLVKNGPFDVVVAADEVDSASTFETELDSPPTPSARSWSTFAACTGPVGIGCGAMYIA